MNAESPPHPLNKQGGTGLVIFPGPHSSRLRRVPMIVVYHLTPRIWNDRSSHEVFHMIYIHLLGDFCNFYPHLRVILLGDYLSRELCSFDFDPCIILDICLLPPPLLFFSLGLGKHVCINTPISQFLGRLLKKKNTIWNNSGDLLKPPHFQNFSRENFPKPKIGSHMPPPFFVCVGGGVYSPIPFLTQYTDASDTLLHARIILRHAHVEPCVLWR